MTMGEFLQHVIEWIYELWPIRIIRTWEQGVRIKNGTPTQLLTSMNGWFGTGIHAFWPIIGEIQSEEVNSRVIETSWQTLSTKDGHAISFSLAARFKIRDLMKMYVAIYDSDETIQNQLSAAASTVVGLLDLDELNDNFPSSVAVEARKRLSEWGVTLYEVSMFNCVEAQSLRLMNDTTNTTPN